MSRKPTRFSRRALLQGGICTTLMPALEGCSRNFLKLPIPFSGEVKGEDYALGHELRDHQAPLPRPEPEGKMLDTLVVGGGPSGMSCAWKLLKSGQDNFLVLDKEAVLGGLCRGERDEELGWVVGSHYVDFPNPACKHLCELYQDMGIILGFEPGGWPIVDERCFLKLKDAHHIFTGRTWHPEEFPRPLATVADQAEHKRFMDEALKWSKWTDAEGRPAFGIPLSRISEDPKIRSLDGITFTAYLDKEGYRSKLLRWYLTNRLQDEYGTPIDRLSAWAGLQFFRDLLVDPKDCEQANQPNILTWPEGLGVLGERMSNLLPADKKRTHQHVLRLENREDHVWALVRDLDKHRTYSLRAKHAVFAAPKMQVYNIVPQLESAGRDEFKDLPYVSWMVAVVHFRSLPTFPGGRIGWDNLFYNSWTLGYINNQHQEIPRRAANRRHVVSMYAAFPWQPRTERTEMLVYGWDYWARMFLHELQKGHPDAAEHIERMDIWKWGHPMRQTVAGSVFGPMRQRMLKPFGRIHFAHVDVCGVPVYEESTYRGVEVAETIMTREQIPFTSSLG
ncbi:MAG: NAD(P)-binding protein [Deltaproteobacteria bacterium]|nr:NAD(P)-binding protein [Deltaproteobacteria bacterium]